MRAVLDDAAGLHDDDAIAAAGLIEPVGDDDGGSPGHGRLGGAIEPVGVFGVRFRCRLVEDREFRIPQSQPSECDELRLRRRQPMPVIADDRVQAARQGRHEMFGVDSFQGVDEFGVVGVGCGEEQIVSQRRCEHVVFLTEVGDLLPPDSASKATAGGVTMAGDEPGERRLSRSGGADDGDALAVTHLQCHSLEHGVTGAVGELEAFEANELIPAPGTTELSTRISRFGRLGGIHPNHPGHAGE